EKCLENREAVAIKKVLLDKRYKFGELKLMCLMDDPNIICLKHHFFSTISTGELFLNLVMEYVPESMYRVLKFYNTANQRMPLIYVKLYMYQKSLKLYVKICDFGNAKVLVLLLKEKLIYHIYIPSSIAHQNSYLVLLSMLLQLIFGRL
ncbi:hypothetical protein S83_023490, partial [Arachis hypogaea]